MGRADWLVVAVSGTTCSGKTTLATKLKELFEGSILLHQDDYFLDVASEKHTIIKELNHINFEILSSLDNDGFFEKVKSILEGEIIPGLTSSGISQIASAFQISQTCSIEYIPNILILDGFLLLNEPRIVELCDVKLFVTLDEEECWARRSVRTYEPPDPPGYFQLCVWPSYLLHSQQMKNAVSDVIYLDGKKAPDELLRCALDAIFRKLCLNQ